jgi:trans-2,3-dihydro-3-hydroxyanthranilate isomerase
VIEQGHAIGRPSKIVLGLEFSGGKLEGASIGGSAIRLSEGFLEL